MKTATTIPASATERTGKAPYLVTEAASGPTDDGHSYSQLSVACCHNGVLLEITEGPLITEPVIKNANGPGSLSYFVPTTWPPADALARFSEALARWHADHPTWATTDRLALFDAEIDAATERAIRLRVERRRLADRLNPTVNRVPLDAVESKREQHSHAAFSLATSALGTALETAEDPDLTIRGVQGWVHVVEDEVRATKRRARA